KVSEKIIVRRYQSGCSMMNCSGKCCHLGADVDLRERDRILGFADVIKSLMDETQNHDSAQWFGDEFSDSDFPTARAVTTRLEATGCVFLNSLERCVLHTAEEKLPGRETLKPFFCRAYPLCIEEGSLTVDDHQVRG